MAPIVVEIGRSGRSLPQGGAVVQVTKMKGAEEAFESLDGKFVYYAKVGVPGIWKVPVAGGEETQVLDRSVWNFWALTGQGICFFDLADSTPQPSSFAVSLRAR